MDDAKFLYFTTLIKYSITDQVFLFIIKIIEFFPLFIDFFSNPIRLRYFFIGRKKSYSSNSFDDSILKKTLKLSYFRQFRNLRDSKDLYPIYFLIIDLVIIFFYEMFFFLVIIFHRIRKKKVQNDKKNKGFYIFLQKILINFYDHFVFRSLSIFFYDIIICYLCKSQNYLVLIFILLCFIYLLYLNMDYFSSFRLCIKFDINNKYIFDDKFIANGDYCLTFLKISLSFEYNIDDEKICHFFDMINIIITIIGIIRFYKEPTYNIIGVLHAFFFISFICLFFLNIISHSVANTNSIFFIYVFICLLIPFLITYQSIRKKFNILVRTTMKDNNIQMIQQFEFLCEYYETPHYNYLLKNICFNSKIRESEVNQLLTKNSTIVGEDETVIISSFDTKKFVVDTKDIKRDLNYYVLCRFSNVFKQGFENPNNDRNLNLFYYYICKIFIELISDINNYFQLIFEIRKILNKLKYTNYIYYMNLRYYYQILCQKHSMYDNNDMLLYNESICKIFDTIILFTEEFEKFLSSEIAKTPNDYISFSKKVGSVEIISKHSYEHIIDSSIKNEYQKLLLRVILECLLNKVFSLSGMMLVSSDIGMYEEILDKYYNNEKVLKIKIDLLNRTSRIIKIGKDLNIYWNKPFENLIPPEFQKIGLEKFYNDEPQDNNTNKNKFLPQKFHFIVWNKSHDLKQFVYEYGIYPKLEENIAFVDGNYKLGKNILIVTKKYIHSIKEKIFTLSDSLEKIMYINKSLLMILNRYDISLEINDFLQDDKTYMFDITKYCSYIYSKVKKLESICNPEEILIVNQLIQRLNENGLVRNIKTRYQFVYLFSVFDNDYENCFYSVKEYKNKKGISIRKEKSIINWQLKDEDFQSVSKEKDMDANKNISNFNTLYSSIAFDTKSQISQQSVSSTLFSVNTSIGRKKIDIQTNNNKNYIIIIFNICLIIVAFFCLIYENYLNNILENKMNLYRIAYTFNRYLLNIMVSYLSLLKICDKYNHCEQYLIQFVSKFDSFNKIDEIILSDMYLNMEKISSLYKELKMEIEKSGSNEIEKYISALKEELYISYVNGDIVLNKLPSKKFDYLMKTFINKLIMTTNDDNFSNISIYKVIVDKDLNPLNILINDTSIQFSQNQLYIYEIMISYLDYSNHFFILQKEIEKNSDNQLRFNKISLVIFIIGLIFSNILIMTSCFLLLRIFQSNIEKKLIVIERLLKRQNIIDKLIERIILVKDLLKFYSHHPMETITKLSGNMKKQDKKKNKSNLSNNKEINNQNEKEILGHSLFFILKKFLILLIILNSIYIIYSIIFVKVSNDSFSLLQNVMTIIYNSAYVEDLTYMMIGITQLLQYISIPQSGLYPIFYDLLNKDNSSIDDNSDFFSDLFRYHQEIYLYERREKIQKKSFPTDAQIIDFNCSTFFKDINDENFAHIINNNPNKNYLQQMINFCFHINIMIFSSEELYMDYYFYSIMKLFFINSNSVSHFPKYSIDILYEIIVESVILYKPLKLHLGNYYLKFTLKNRLKKHIYTLLFFLLGNIALEIIFFGVIKFLIIDNIEDIIKHLNKLLRILKVV